VALATKIKGENFIYKHYIYKMNATVKKPLIGTNFALTLAILVGSFFGAPEQLSNQVVMSVVGVVAAIGAVRQFLPNAKFDGLKARLLDPNTWQYLLAFVSTIGIPKLADLVPPLHDLSDALISGNWGLVISKGLALLTMVYYLLIKKE
jgi:hypothetical protein